MEYPSLKLKDLASLPEDRVYGNLTMHFYRKMILFTKLDSVFLFGLKKPKKV